MLKLPLVIRSSGEVFFCRTVERAERELEPPDVRSGEYTGYDREGRLLRIAVASEEVPGLFGLSRTSVDAVKIEPAEEEPAHAEEMRSVLLSYLGRIGVSTGELEQMPLNELLLEAMTRVDVY